MSLEARIADLMLRHLQGCLTPDEASELKHWIESSPKNQALFDQYSNLEFLEAAWKKDTALMERVRPSGFPVRRMRMPVSSWLRYAAAILVLLGVGAYFFYARYRPAKQPAVVVRQQATLKNDAAPGSNRAVLTLSDGSKIVLEKDKNGQLAKQGGALVVSKNGELQYKGASARGGEMIYNTLSTNRGEQFPLQLSDGTRIWLNAASSIRFPVSFTGAERTVEITGEAYFEVAADASKPFKVLLNGMEIAVLGTHFNVNGYADEASVKTTLLEGSVKIKKAGETLVLTPGQQADLSTSGRISLIKDADIEKAVSWKEGYFHFNRNDLETVMREISRWYDVDIVYENDSKKREQHFSGDIEKSIPLSSVLRVLEKSQVKFRIEGKKLIVEP